MEIDTLEIVDLKISFGELVVLDQFCFTLNRGQSLWIQGANGSGKSSLLKCLAGINSYSGTVLVSGHAPTDPKARKLMTYCPDEPALYYDLTLRQHAKFTAMLASSHDIYKSICELYYYFGIEKYFDQTPINLSKGTKQKASLCLTLGMKKDIIILDEPFNGLDSTSLRKLTHLIATYAEEGISMIFTAHQEIEVIENVKNIRTITLSSE